MDSRYRWPAVAGTPSPAGAIPGRAGQAGGSQRAHRVQARTAASLLLPQPDPGPTRSRLGRISLRDRGQHGSALGLTRRDPSWPCEDFLHCHQGRACGAPAVRPAGPDRTQSAESPGRMRDWRRSAPTRPERESGGATARLRGGGLPRPTGGSPTGAAPHAGQLARTRRPVAQAVTRPVTAPARSDRAVLLAPGILSPRKDHRQGRARGRVADAMAQAPPLTLIFHGKTSAPIRRTDRTRLVLPTGCHWRSGVRQPGRSSQRINGEDARSCWSG